MGRWMEMNLQLSIEGSTGRMERGIGGEWEQQVRPLCGFGKLHAVFFERKPHTWSW
jgi:hypothetical protein